MRRRRHTTGSVSISSASRTSLTGLAVERVELGGERVGQPAAHELAGGPRPRRGRHRSVGARDARPSARAWSPRAGSPGRRSSGRPAPRAVRSPASGAGSSTRSDWRAATALISESMSPNWLNSVRWVTPARSAIWALDGRRCRSRSRSSRASTMAWRDRSLRAWRPSTTWARGRQGRRTSEARCRDRRSSQSSEGEGEAIRSRLGHRAGRCGSHPSLDRRCRCGADDRGR